VGLFLVTLFSSALALPDSVITLTLSREQADALHTFLWTATPSPRHLSPEQIRATEALLGPITQQLLDQLIHPLPLAA
jgi:hypothetical protein